MDNHLGYEKSERSDNDDYCNGYKHTLPIKKGGIECQALDLSIENLLGMMNSSAPMFRVFQY